MADKTNNIIYRIEVDSRSGKLNIDGVTKSFEQADKAFLKLQKDVAKGIPNATKNVKNLGDATGSATSATMELSRVISDAPYGIRGMANNITQLVSQLGTASTKAGGLTGALKLMGKQLMGPLGIVFAITAAVSALDFFFGANKKAEESMDSFRVTASKTATDLKSLLIVMNEDMLSKEDLANVVDKVNEKYKDLNISIDEEGKLTKESRIQIDKKIKSMGKLALANAMMAEIEKKQSEIAKAAVEMQEDTSKDLEKLGLEDLETFKQRQDETEEAYVKRMNALGKHQEGYYKGEIDVDRVNRIARVRRQVANFEETKKRVEEQTKELLKISTTEGFFDSFFDSPDKKKTKGGGKDKKISPFKTPKELEIDVKNAENSIIQYEKKIEDARLKKELNDKLSEATTEEEKRKIREEYQLKRLQNQLDSEKKILELKLATEKTVVNTKRDNHIDDLKRATDLYIHKVKLNDKLSAKEKEQMIGIAESQLQIATNQANTEADEAIIEIKDKYKTLFGFFEQLGIARKDALTSGFGGEEEGEDSEIAKLNAFVSKYMEISGVLTSFMNGEFERQLTTEQNKTNALNNELRERLNNENLSADERKNIQLKIARNDEVLRKKQEQIKKKQFRLNKAANIANALVNTYATASIAFKNSMANPLNKVLPDGGLSKAKISAGIATAFGLANVAMIARQKFQSSISSAPSAGALGGGGSSGSGRGDRSFNFNLAGASQENQLAQTLQGRFDQPLQAYVVSRDITNQQQLDLDIENNASFG